MAQQSRARRAATRRSGQSSPAAAALGRVTLDALGFALVAASLVALLSALHAEGAVAQPIGRLLGRLFGWLAPGAAVWIGLVALLLISRRIHPRPWPWTRLGAGAVATFALLGIAALEAQRRGGPDDAPGGGLVGRWVADSLQAWFGTPSTVGVLILALVPSLFIAMRVSPVATATWIVAAVRLGLRGASALRSRIHRPEFTINRHESSQARRERPARAQHDDSAHAIPATDSLNATVPDAPGAQPRSSRWKTPPLTMFHARKSVERPAGELRQQAQIIEETLASFNIDARVVEANQGPVVTQFGVEPATGVPVSRITARVNDLALRLGSTSIRIEAPVPGRRMLGIEVPNSSVSLVTLREVMESTAAERSRARIPLALGKDIAGKSLVGDLARMPHLLIAGATGSGKSVCINTLIASMLSQFTPDELQLLMIDPKMVELIAYNGVPHLRMPVITEMDKVVGTLKWALKEMERRYKLFAACSARNIDSYNRGIQARAQGAKAAGDGGSPNAADLRPLPYLVLIVDELADLMMTAPEEAERAICRLAQLARATGIHLIIATQRPSVDVLTGLIKANFPTRIAFAVTSQVDSRVILDTVGAERLLGRGDMLYQPPDASKPIRVQGTYVSDQEIEALVEYWRRLGAPQYDDHDLEDVDTLGQAPEPANDDLFDRAVALAHETQRVSASLLQRRLGIGYPRAARLLDLLDEQGIIEPSDDGRSWRVLPDD